MTGKSRPGPSRRGPGGGVQPAVTHWNNPAKLDEEKVREIKEALREGERVADLAARYGVGTSTIRKIRLGEAWGWVN